MNLQKHFLPLVATISCHFFASQCLAAEALHYWRFEDDPGATADSVGESPLRPRAPVTGVTLSDVGPGRYFPKALAVIGRNEFAIASVGPVSGLVAENTTPVVDAFTIEMFANFDELGPFEFEGRSMSVLAGSAFFPCCPGPSEFGWAFRVAWLDEDDQPKPPELDLVLSDGTEYANISSGIVLEEHVDYFLSASFDVNADARFFAVNLETDELQVANVTHTLSSLNPYPNVIVMGPQGWSLVDGIVDEVRFSRGVVAEQDLLVNLAVPEPTAFLLLLLTGVAGVGRCRR